MKHFDLKFLVELCGSSHTLTALTLQDCLELICNPLHAVRSWDHGCMIHVCKTQQKSFFLFYPREKSVLSLLTALAELETNKVEHFRVASCQWANISKVGSGRCSYYSTEIPIHWPLVEITQWIRQLLKSDPRKKIMIKVCLIALTSSFFHYMRQHVCSM